MYNIILGLFWCNIMTEKLFLKNLNFTSREMDIITLITFNIRATKSIAYILEISPRTVEIYIHKVVKKMNIRSRKDVANLIIDKKYDAFLESRYKKLISVKFKNESFDFFDKNYIDLKVNQEFENLNQNLQKVTFYERRLKKIMQVFFVTILIYVAYLLYAFWSEN